MCEFISNLLAVNRGMIEKTFPKRIVSRSPREMGFDTDRITPLLVIFSQSDTLARCIFLFLGGERPLLGFPPTPLLLFNGNIYSFWTRGASSVKQGMAGATVATIICTSFLRATTGSMHTGTHPAPHTHAAVTNTCTAVIAHAAGHTSRPPCGHQRSNYTSQYETH